MSYQNCVLRTVGRFSVVLAVVGTIGLHFGSRAVCAQDGGAVTASQEIDLPVIDAMNVAAVKEAIGRQVFIDGTIRLAEWSGTGKVMNIEFDGPEGQALLGAVFEKSRKGFDEGFNGNAATTFTGAKVRVKGRLEEYGGQLPAFKGRTQVLLRLASQVTIIEPAPVAPTNAPISPTNAPVSPTAAPVAPTTAPAQ